MDIETLAMALALSKSKGSSSGGTDENLQNAVQALADSICPNRYTSGSNPEIQSGDFFYIDDDMYLRYSNDLIPANSSREDIDNSSRLVTSNGGLSDAINFLLHNSQHNGDALWDLFDDICPNRYMSGSNPEIEPNQFFYLDENMHLRCSNDLIPANSSEEDIKNSSVVIMDQGGLSNTISSLLENTQSGNVDEEARNTIEALSASICPDRYTSGSNPEIEEGDFFYIDDDPYLRYCYAGSIPANSSREDIDQKSASANTMGVGLTTALKMALESNDEIVDIYNQFIEFKNNLSTSVFYESTSSQTMGIIEPGYYFYLENELRQASETIPKGTNSNDLRQKSNPVAHGIANKLQNDINSVEEGLSSLRNDLSSLKYTSGSNPEIEPNRFFYIDDDLNLRYSNALIPANSSRNDIDSSSISVASVGGLSSAISSLVANIQNGGEDEEKSSITLYNAADDAITSVISIGTAPGSLQIGTGTQALGDNAHAEGFYTFAQDDNAHAEGNGTTASGAQSHAEGSSTKASGNSAHAEGNGTTASGAQSHAEGAGTKANHASQHVFGQFNIEDPSTENINIRGTYVEIVGNGKNSNTRSNARTLDWSGNEVLAGNISVEGGSLTLGSGANAVTITATQLQQLLDMLQS